MGPESNRLVWDGRRGHYEVYYLTLTDPLTEVGLWIRYSLLAPTTAGQDPTLALWFLAMDPRIAPKTFARKVTLPADELRTSPEPFELHFGEAILREDRMAGDLDDARWDLRFVPSSLALEHVHPMLRAARAAQTTLTLPQADLSIDGEVEYAGRQLELRGARGGQAHLWGTKHARTWAWVHCNDMTHEDGSTADGDVIDAVSVVIERFGREVGPSTPVVGRIGGQTFAARSPWRVLTAPSTYALSGWRFEAIDGNRRLVAEIDADRELLAGVTYTDPDGEPAYCYNTETASLRLQLWKRSGGIKRWELRQVLRSRGRAHFEYGQRRPVPGIELLV